MNYKEPSTVNASKHQILSPSPSPTTQMMKEKAYISQMLLSPYEEQLISIWFVVEALFFRAPYHSEIKKFAQIMLNLRNKEAQVGSDWTKRFFSRHPEIRHLISHRDFSSPNSVPTKMPKLDFLEAYNTLSNMYNFDRSNIFYMQAIKLEYDTDKTDTQTSPSSDISENTECTTVIECISAAGKKLKPMVLFQAYDNAVDILPPTVPDWSFLVTEKGLQSPVSIYSWLNDCFFPETATSPSASTIAEYKLLLVDGNRCNFTPEIIQLCLRNQIIVVCTTPEMENYLRPFKETCFLPLVNNFNTRLKKMSLMNNTVEKYDFIQCYNATRSKILTTANIRKSYRDTQIWPRQQQQQHQQNTVSPSLISVPIISVIPSKRQLDSEAILNDGGSSVYTRYFNEIGFSSNSSVMKAAKHADREIEELRRKLAEKTLECENLKKLL